MKDNKALNEILDGITKNGMEIKGIEKEIQNIKELISNPHHTESLTEDNIIELLIPRLDRLKTKHKQLLEDRKRLFERIIYTSPDINDAKQYPDIECKYTLQWVSARETNSVRNIDKIIMYLLEIDDKYSEKYGSSNASITKLYEDMIILRNKYIQES